MSPAATPSTTSLKTVQVQCCQPPGSPSQLIQMVKVTKRTSGVCVERMRHMFTQSFPLFSVYHICYTHNNTIFIVDVTHLLGTLCKQHQPVKATICRMLHLHTNTLNRVSIRLSGQAGQLTALLVNNNATLHPSSV